MNDITYSIVEALFEAIQRIIASVLCFILDCFTFNTFTPNIGKFAELLGGQATLQKLLEIMSDVGWVIAAILFVATCVTYWLGSVIEIKDTILGSLGRTGVAIFTCLIISQFLTQTVAFAEGIGQNIEKEICAALGGEASAEGNPDWSSIIWVQDEDDEIFKIHDDGSYTMQKGLLKGVNVSGVAGILVGAGVVAVTAADFIALSPLTTLNLVFHIIVYIVLGYFFLKLYIELIRRYVVYGALTLISPAIPGFLATKDSSQVFTTFLKMYGTQIGMIIATRIWIILTVVVMTRNEVGLLEAFLIIGFINIGVRLEQLARDLGLTVTGQGMALLDSVVMTGLIAARAIGGVTTNALIQGGSFTGKTGMVQMGRILQGKPADTASVLRTMEQSAGGVLREAFGGGRVASITNAEKADISKLAAAGFSNNRNVNEFLSRLTPEMRKEALQHLIDNNYSKINDILKNEKAGLHLESTGNEFINGKGMPVQLMDESGKAYRDGFINSVAQSDQAIAFTGENGEQLFFNPVDGCLHPEDLEKGVTMGQGAVIDDNTGEIIQKAEEIGDTPTSAELKYGIHFDRNQMGFKMENGELVRDKEASHYQFKGSKDESFMLHNQNGSFKDGAGDIVGYSRNGMETSLPKDNSYSATYDKAYDEAYSNAISSGMSESDAISAAHEAGGEALIGYLNNSNGGYYNGTGMEVTSAKRMENSTVTLSTGQKMNSYELTLKNSTTGEEVKHHFVPANYNHGSIRKDNCKDGMLSLKVRNEKRRVPSGGGATTASAGGINNSQKQKNEKKHNRKDSK